LTLVGDVVRAQSRLKSLYRSRGVPVSGENVYGVRQREAWQAQLPASAQPRATRLYAHFDFLLEQKKEAEADLLREARKHPIVSASLPHAPTVLELLRSGDRDAVELGLDADDGRGVDQGAGSASRGLSRHHNRFLKHIFKGAATTVITQRNKDPIYARYQRLLEGGTKPTLAKLSLARMIAATVLRMWKDEEPYDPRRAARSAEDREG
jgi:hypothetical protein